MARRSNQKRRSDPNAPKKALAAWSVFFSDNREEVAKQNPDLSYIEISKKLGEMWRQADENTKRRYQKQYQASQAEYGQKLAAYQTEKKNKKQQQQSSGSKKNNAQSKKGNNGNNNNNKNNNNNNNDESNEDDNQL